MWKVQEGSFQRSQSMSNLILRFLLLFYFFIQLSNPIVYLFPYDLLLYPKSKMQHFPVIRWFQLTWPQLMLRLLWHLRPDRVQRSLSLALAIEEDLHCRGRSQAKALKFASVDGPGFKSAVITLVQKALGNFNVCLCKTLT